MSKILLIGNSGLKKNSLDGQTIKVRLYLKKIRDEGFDVVFIDLEGFAKRPISTLYSIKKNIRTCDRIVLLTAERGSKILIPFINFINQSHKKPFIFPLVGISVLHYSIDKLSEKDKFDFLINGNYSLCKVNKNLITQLKKITYILPETDTLTSTFTNFYGLSNVHQLNNFRESKQNRQSSYLKKGLRLVYISRVMAVKGVFDILKVIKCLNNEGNDVYLDIYGQKKFNDEENNAFDSYLDGKFISYKGTIQNSEVVDVISRYDLFVFPTRYHGEGTPGVIAEALIAGTPILTSDFLQARFLLKDGVDSIFYKMFDKEDLKNKLIKIINNKDLLNTIREGAIEAGKKFTYEYERTNFLKYVCGVDETEL